MKLARRANGGVHSYKQSVIVKKGISITSDPKRTRLGIEGHVLNGNPRLANNCRDD